MRTLRLISLLAGLLAAFPAQAADFDPASEGLLVVNLHVPSRIEGDARLELGSMTLWSDGVALPGEVVFTSVDATALSGQAPRWAHFAADEGVLDSLVLNWNSFAVRAGEAWTAPEVRRSTVIPLHQRLRRGEAAVLNLSWRLDAAGADDLRWHPVVEVEDLPEPPAGGRIYVSESGEGIVSVFERVSGRMVRALAVGGEPRDLAFDPVQQRLYVAVAGRDELAVIDVAGQAVLRRLPLSFGADPTRVLLTRDRQTIAVLAPGQDQLFLYSAASLQEVARARVGQDPVAVGEDPRGGRLFVSCRTAGEIHVVDPASGRVLSRFSGFESPAELIVLDSGVVAVGQDRGSRVDLVDPNSGTVQNTLRICGSSIGLLEVPRFDRLYVMDDRCAEIAIFRTDSGLEVGSIRLDERAGLPALAPRGTEILVPFPDSRRVAILSADRGELQLTCDVGLAPWRAIAP